MTSCATYTCRQPLAICYLLPASCTPLQTLRFLLYALSVQLSTHASNSPLPALRSLLPALRSLLPTSCLLRSLLSPLCSLRSQPSALSHLLSAPCLLIGTLRKMVFREVVSMGSEPQLFHTSKKRVRSATSRRTPTLSVCYQLAFFTPGMRPFEAISRNWIRLMPN